MVIPSWLKYDPSFVEEAVFLTMRKRELSYDPLVKRFFLEKDQIYEKYGNGDERAKAFGHLNLSYFCETGLEEYFRNIFLGFKFSLEKNLILFVKRVWSEKEEGAELYDKKSKRTILICLQASRIQDGEKLEAYLNEELMHVSDILDPLFDYDHQFVFDAETRIEEEILRRCFALVWDIYIEARLKRREKRNLDLLSQKKNAFERAFPLLRNEVRESVFHDLMTRVDFTHQELLEIVRCGRGLNGVEQWGHRCPLCRFPSPGGVVSLPDSWHNVAEAIKKDYPTWQLEMGACMQCCELYRVSLCSA